MDRETARQEIKRQISCTKYLTPSKSGMYICPLCHSGTGRHQTGAVKYYGTTNTWHCHACKRGGDVIDLFRLETGTNYNTALSLLAQEIGITIEPYIPKNTPKRLQSDFSEPGYINPLATDKNRQGSEKMNFEADYTAYYQECSKRLKDPAAVEYLQRRGISLATAEAYCIGYDPAADPATAPGAMGDEYRPHPCQRLIIPTSNGHYVGRRIDGEPKWAKINSKGSTPAIFNECVLYAHEVREVFVTEGAFDALSILEAGAAAIALNSADNAEKLITQLERQKTAATLILCLDNDDSGKKATETIKAGLQRLNVSFITANISAGYKDPNEALTGNREAFMEAIAKAQRQAGAKPDNTLFYIDNVMAGEIERFKQDKKTGFANLDENAGGLYSGLYVLAAISSLGKTSFALQLADQLATSGNDVIFFSLEQSRLELVSKSLARMTAQADRDKAVTSLSIRKGYLPPQVVDAAESYKAAISDRISIVEGNFSCNISFIGDYIRRYVKRNNTRPIVFVDYLQILQPADDSQKLSTKETVDSSVTELKRISRELDLTLIVISSVNRANYLTPIDFESLKESGGIEFSADVIWGLQLQCLNDPNFEKKSIKEKRDIIKEAKADPKRKIEFVCLKNRYGIANYSCYFDYFPANDLFAEVGNPDPITTTPKAGRKL